MTVKEFITKLQEMPQDLEVYDWGGFKVEGCHIVTDYPDRDPADPKCQDITVVMID